MAKRRKTEFHDLFIREVRVSYVPTQNQPFRIRDSEDVARFVRSILTENSREHFVAMYLNGSHNVASFSTISIGTANSTLVHPREVFQRAILTGAVSLVVSHNHPSGDVTPSSADFEVTAKLKEAGLILCIPLLDHVIVTDASHRSLREDPRW